MFTNVDDAILATIDAIRAEHGACTAGEVAARMRIDREAVITRCRSLRNRGLVLWSDVPGSLRRPSDGRQRLYDLIVQRAVEKEANGGDPLFEPADGVVVSWCETVIAMAVAEAWPELVPAEQGDVTGTQPQPATSPVAGPVTDGLHCIPCDRNFKHQHMLNQHLKSRGHADALAAWTPTSAS